ncbi:MAG: hypothetical protein V8Q76_12415 [Bacteroides intestinalis]
MLLTATPFNNRPEDIYSMLKLFQIPSKSTLKTVENLGAAFKDLISRYKDLAEGQRKNILSKSEIKSEADSIAQNILIISPLVVRRSRLDLEEIPEYKEDLKRQHINPVIPEPPVQLGYYLGDIRELYLRTLNLISPTDEEKKITQNFITMKVPVISQLHILLMTRNRKKNWIRNWKKRWVPIWAC